METYEYAIMAGGAYISTRGEVNQFPVPTGWSQFNPKKENSGFEAVSFRKGDEVVISFAGRAPGWSRDNWEIFCLYNGDPSDQLREAAAYYLEMKKLYGNRISLTGHSLGGGIAALLGVFFNVHAETFDQAPFSRSATEAMREDLINYLTTSQNGNPALYSRENLQLLAPELFTFTNLAEREGNVTGRYVQGEILSNWFSSMIGTQISLQHDSTSVSGTQLHDQSLLTLFLMNPGFQKLTKEPENEEPYLSGLVSMMNDGNLFYNDPNKLVDAKENFTERLIKYEVAADPLHPEQGMLTRFTNDLEKIAAQGGLSLTNEAMQKTLIAFAMEKYYTEQPDAANELFDDAGITEGGGLHFKVSDVAASLTGDEGAKGYNLYFDAYLNGWQPEEKEQAQAVLEGTKDWYVQAGGPALKAKAGDDRAFMIGGDQGDDLTGGMEDDVLYGGEGRDNLTGGRGNDILIGGKGNDAYYFHLADGADTDTIIDSGENNIYIERSTSGKMTIVKNVYGTDNNQYNTIDGEVIVTRNSNRLELPNGSHVDLPLSIEDFGINLINIPQLPVIEETLYGDTNPLELNDWLWGDKRNTRIESGDGNDIVSTGFDGMFGNDWFLVGNGDDAVGAPIYNNTTGSYWFYGLDGLEVDGIFSLDTSNDVIEGGSGQDTLIGGHGDDRIFGDSFAETTELIEAGETDEGSDERGNLLSGRNGNDFIYGSDCNDALFGCFGNDLLVGGAGNDAIYGDDDCVAASRNWQFTITHGLSVNFNDQVFIEDNSYVGDDTIYAGAGDDFVYAGDGDDEVYAGIGDDTVRGEGGDDFIDGGEGDDILEGDGSGVVVGEQGNDVIYGGDGSDRIWGQAGSDSLYGGDGSDEIYGDDVLERAGNDYIDGGDGNDHIWGHGGNDTIFGGEGNDEIIGDNGNEGAGNDYLDGGAGDDEIYGGHGDDMISGGSGVDVLDGNEGDDRLDGGDDDDTVVGAEGADIIYGGAGNDNLHGDASNVAQGEQGDDFIDGGEGDDGINGYGGNDTLYGGAGNDSIWGDLGDDAIYGGDGNDQLVGEDGDDTIDGGAGLDAIFGGAGDDIIDGGSENDQLQGDDGDDRIDGGAGDDIIVGSEGNDRLYGGDGNDQIQGDAGSDYLDGGSGNDTLVGLAGNDELYGGGGTDQIWGGDGSDTINGGAGDDTIYGESGDDIMSGADGNDTLYGGSGNDVLDGGAGADAMYGLGGDDIYVIDNVSDVFGENPDEGTDTVRSFIAYSLGANMENLTLMGGAALNGQGNEMDNILTGNGAANTLTGGVGKDTLDGGGGNDLLYGGEDNDTVIGGGGDDTLYGGAGNDYLQGNDGSDSYIFGRGDGSDIIENYVEDSTATTDTVHLGANITVADLLLVRSSNDLQINIVGTADSLTIRSWFSGDAYKPDQFVFDDSTVMTAAQMDALYTSTNIYGTAGDDYLYGYATNNYIYGDDGNDTIIGGAGFDSLYGGLGNDTYYFDRGYDQDIIVDTDEGEYNINQIQMAPGIFPSEISVLRLNNDLKLSIIGTNDAVLIKDWYSSGEYSIKRILFSDGTVWNAENFWDANAVIYGSNADDWIYGGDGNDSLYGGQGDDFIQGEYGDDFLCGGSGDDILRDNYGTNIMDGGAGNDTLFGVGGENTYIFNRGYGNDVISSHPLYNRENELSVGRDTIILGEDITPDNITIGNTIAESIYNGWHHLELSINIGNGEGVTVRNFYPEVHPQQGYPDNITDFGVTRFILGDGSVLNLEDMISLSTYSYGMEGEGVTGSSSGDVIVGGNGNDRIYALDGSDTVSAGGGYDLVNGGAGNDTIYAGDACDILIGGAGDDILYGEADNDMIMSGKGNDFMVGGDGDDNYIYYRGDGVDTILDVSTAMEGNSLLFGDIYYEDIQGKVEVDDNEVIIRIGNGDEIHLTGIDPETGLPTSHVVDVIGFADGKAITYQDLLAGNNPVIRGTEGDDFIEGSSLDNIMEGFSGNDTIYGGDGNDTIYGGDGNDIVYGGRGDDTLHGGSGRNTYYYFPGDGSDTVYDNGVLYGPIDNVISFGSGISPGGLKLRLGSLLIDLGNEGDSIRIPEFNPQDARANPVIGTFEFADGTILTYDELIDRGFDLDGTTGDDVITGTNVVDRINAMGGNDDISSGAGDDVLTGGRGDDSLAGGEGNDTYVFNLGDGVDTITDLSLPSEGNTIIIGDGITKNDLSFVRDDGFLAINVGDNGDAIQLLNFDQDEINGSLVVRTLEFADGTQMNLTDLLNRAPVVVNPIDNQTTMEDSVFLFTIPSDTFHDSDAGDSLAYSATIADGTALPAWLTFDSATMTFAGVPTNDDVGMLSLTVTVTDTAGTSVSSDFKIEVLNVNDVPVVPAPILDRTIQGNEPFTFAVPANTFRDVDAGDTLTYTATLADGTSLPSWLTFDAATRTFSGTPTNNNTGLLSLRVTATDTSGALAADEFNLTVERNAEVIYGTNHFDFISAGNNDTDIYGLGGMDIIWAGNGNDAIYGGDGIDILLGNGGNDILDGGACADLMTGGAGDDTYIVDNWLDVLVENYNGGTDSVQSSVTYGLGANMENLQLTGTEAINGTGNILNNILSGNVAVNTLTGNDGNDTLDGNAGNDGLSGGNGSDTYLFRRTDGIDTVTETAGLAGDTDVVRMTDGISQSEPVIVKQNNDLYLFIDANNYMKINSEFAQPDYGVERLEVSDGYYITRSDIENIVNTMSAINNDPGMDVIQKFNAMRVDQTYITTLAQSWHQP